MDTKNLHRAGNMYILNGAATEPLPVMLVRVGTRGVLAVAMRRDLNRACSDRQTTVIDPRAISDKEMKKIMAGRTYKYVGTFPSFEVNKLGEVVCTKL